MSSQKMWAFRPLGGTINISVTTSSVSYPLNYPGQQTPEYTQPQIGGGVRSILLQNLGSTTVYVQFGKTASRSGGPLNPQEPPTASVPAVSSAGVLNTAGSLPIPAGAIEVFTLGDRMDSMAVITVTATNANFFYTIGEGL